MSSSSRPNSNQATAPAPAAGAAVAAVPDGRRNDLRPVDSLLVVWERASEPRAPQPAPRRIFVNPRSRDRINVLRQRRAANLNVNAPRAAPVVRRQNFRNQRIETLFDAIEFNENEQQALVDLEQYKRHRSTIGRIAEDVPFDQEDDLQKLREVEMNQVMSAAREAISNPATSPGTLKKVMHRMKSNFAVLAEDQKLVNKAIETTADRKQELDQNVAEMSKIQIDVVRLHTNFGN